MSKRSNFSIDPETATRAALDAEIERLMGTTQLLRRRSTHKNIFATVRKLEGARERRFGVPAPKRNMRARQG